MNNKIPLVLLAVSLGLLSACSTTSNRAPVVERTVGAKRAPPVEAPKEDARGTYTVKRGDTLLRIALEHGQNYRDIVAWNNLANPNELQVDQVLRIQEPAPATSGVQTSSVTMPPDTHAPGVPPPARKTAPRADKRPYSDSALADLQRPDGAPGAKGDKPADVRVPVVVVPGALPAPGSAAPDDGGLSWAWPSDGKVVATFDEGKNKGIDIAGKAGQHVLAAGAGKVMYAGSGIRGYGNLVIVKHSNSLLSAYAHNRAIVVKEGQSVNKGQTIAEMGDSDADGVKLHFEIRQQGKPVDPSKFLPNR
jgi:lipoprotein NlpD